MFEGLMEVTRSCKMIRVVEIGLFVITDTVNNIDIDVIQTFVKRLKTERTIILAILFR